MDKPWTAGMDWREIDQRPEPPADLVEAVARAIAKSVGTDECDWEAYTDEAQAALAVIQPRLDALEAENARLRRAKSSSPIQQ